MFALLGTRLSSLISRNLQEIKINGIPSIIQTCNATKKAGGQARKQGKPRRGKRRGAKCLDGVHVKSGQILVRQLGYKFHPGKNVAAGRDHTLFALCEGFVKYTSELLQPQPFSLARKPIDYVERNFINVVERPKPRRLICINEHEMKNNVNSEK